MCYHVGAYNYHYPHTQKKMTQNTLNGTSHRNQNVTYMHIGIQAQPTPLRMHKLA